MVKYEVEKGKIERWLHYIFGSKIVFRRFIISLITIIIGAILLFGVDAGKNKKGIWYCQLRPADMTKIKK